MIYLFESTLKALNCHSNTIDLLWGSIYWNLNGCFKIEKYLDFYKNPSYSAIFERGIKGHGKILT